MKWLLIAALIATGHGGPHKPPVFCGNGIISGHVVMQVMIPCGKHHKHYRHHWRIEK